jgi:DNA invertase Pin-like site-specific DNA recombinase
VTKATLLGICSVNRVAWGASHAANSTSPSLAAVAEHERHLINKRTKEALAAVKARGVKLGGYRGVKVDLRRAAAARRKAADAFARQIYPMIHALTVKGLSMAAIARKLTDDGIHTVRGGAWTAGSVSNVITRASAG